MKGKIQEVLGTLTEYQDHKGQILNIKKERETTLKYKEEASVENIASFLGLQVQKNLKWDTNIKSIIMNIAQ